MCPVTLPSLPCLRLSPCSFIIGLIGVAATIYFAIRGFGLSRIRQERSFDLLMLLGTLILPQLSAFGINFFGWKVPVNANEVRALTTPDLLRMAIIVVPVLVISVILGIWWSKRQWLVNAAIWYVIYIVLYTSMFTNGAGFFTGLVGSLGYWLAQQDVNRGSQPLYYYALSKSLYTNSYPPWAASWVSSWQSLGGRRFPMMPSSLISWLS